MTLQDDDDGHAKKKYKKYAHTQSFSLNFVGRCKQQTATRVNTHTRARSISWAGGQRPTHPHPHPQTQTHTQKITPTYKQTNTHPHTTNTTNTQTAHTTHATLCIRKNKNTHPHPLTHTNTQHTLMSCSLAMSWMLKGPEMLRALQMADATRLTLRMVSTQSFCAGRRRVASPECTPAFYGKVKKNKNE